MFREMKFNGKFRTFNEGDIFQFNTGINVLVGENGSGKSTMLDIISGRIKGQVKNIVEMKYDKCDFIAFDFEKDNPRVKGRIDSVQHALSHFISQGQTNKGILERIARTNDSIIIMDQPETGLSIKSVKELISSLGIAVNNNCQIIMSTHHPYLISSVSSVLSLDDKKWIDAMNYLCKEWNSEDCASCEIQEIWCR